MKQPQINPCMQYELQYKSHAICQLLPCYYNVYTVPTDYLYHTAHMLVHV